MDEMTKYWKLLHNPDIPNQKAERYTEERIKAAANENLKDKIKERRFFVFE